eukprot:18039-Heterococcus_DN1.PRE.2
MAAAPTAQMRPVLMLAHPISQVCTMMPLQILKKLVLLLKLILDEWHMKKLLHSTYCGGCALAVAASQI